MGEKWTWPSKKWFAARVTALTGVATMWATTGSWDQEETVAAITLASAALIAYLLPNDEDAPPSAVLESREPHRRG